VRLRLQPDHVPEALRSWHAGREADSEVLQLPDYAAIEAMLGALREGGVAVQEMEVMQADLEDVFVQMMQRH
jgi:ABC-2 type transport system ATP-binding protein